MDYLTFHSFISIPVFIGIYYFGVIVIPIILWRYRHTLQNLLAIFKEFSPKLSERIIWIFLLVLILSEVMWRIMFEMIIAYFQMREYLQHIAG